MKLLITGGAGFIGANFLAWEREKYPQDTLICVDKLTYAGNAQNILPLVGRGEVTFFCEDVANKSAMRRLFARVRPDAVVHFAAESHVDRAIADPAPFVRSNVGGTAVLLEQCRAYGCRFHHVSTDEVYGPLGKGEAPVFEGAPLRPANPYAASKAAADLLCLSYAKTYGMPVTISRGANTYGRFQFPEKLIPRALACIFAGEPVPVYGTGENRRSWLAVRDHCAAVDCVLRHGEAGGVYNIGGEEARNLDLVRSLFSLAGREEKISFVADRPAHDLRYALDDHALRALGWRPAVPFAQGLAETVRWYKEHTAWLEQVRSGAYLAQNDALRGMRA